MSFLRSTYSKTQDATTSLHAIRISRFGLITAAEEEEAFKEAAGIRLRAKLDFSLKKPFVFHSFS